MNQSTTVTRLANKEHRCCWCWEMIYRKTEYKRYAVFDGTPTVVKLHPECYEALLTMIEEEGGFTEWTPGMERPAPNNGAVRR